jgi:glycine/D-amino acid oxidase-like deaminating enzyme
MSAAVHYSAFSGWVERPDDSLPALAGELDCDVAVIGGGYTGMAVALRLAERGADVGLLESAFCGWGASSRNAGHLTPTVAGDPQLLATVYRRRARELVRFADAAVHFTEGLIERLGIECEYEPTGNVSAALSTGQLRRAQRIARILAESGGEVEFVEGRDAGLPHAFLGGILERAGGILNPGRFARGLRDALRNSGARVFERSAVQAVETGGARVVVSVPGGRVRADRVVLATNAFTRDLPFAPRRIVAPLWVTLAETEPIEPARLDATGWVSRSGVYTQHIILESYRPTARGTIVFGSRRPQTPRGPLGAREPEPAVVADIVRGFHERFPSLRDVAPQRAWGGWIAMTPSWLPVAGEAGANVFYAVGYNGHGLAQAPYLGTLLADRLAGDEPHDDLRAVWHARPRFGPAPLFSAPALRAGWAIDRLSDRLMRAG